MRFNFHFFTRHNPEGWPRQRGIAYPLCFFPPNSVSQEDVFNYFHVCSESWESTKPKSVTSPQATLRFLKTLRTGSAAITKYKYICILLRKKKKHRGSGKLGKDGLCYTHWLMEKKISETCSTRAYSSGKQAQKVLVGLHSVCAGCCCKTPAAFPWEA